MSRKRSYPPVPSAAGPAPHQPSDQPDALAAFRTRLATGDYHAVLGRGLHRALCSAAQDQSLNPEIGVLRLALYRLLSEEPDPVRLATGVSRLLAVAVQIARLRPSPDDDLRAILLREVDALDAERAAENALDRRSVDVYRE